MGKNAKILALKIDPTYQTIKYYSSDFGLFINLKQSLVCYYIDWLRESRREKLCMKLEYYCLLLTKMFKCKIIQMY